MRWKVSLVGFCFLIVLGITAYSAVPRFVQAVKNVTVSEPAEEDGETPTLQEEDAQSQGARPRGQFVGYQELLFNDMKQSSSSWEGGEIRFCRDWSWDGAEGVGCRSSQPGESPEVFYSIDGGYLVLSLAPCPSGMARPDGYAGTDCADENSPVKVSYRWNGFAQGFRETTRKVMELRLRCSDNNDLGGALGWGFSAMSDDPGGGLIIVDDLSFFSPVTVGPRFEGYSSESNSSLEGFWVTSGDLRGEVIRNSVAGIDLTEWHTYTIFWEEGNATFLVDGVRVGELLSPVGDESSGHVVSWGMGVSVYLENTIYSPENEDQAAFESLDALLRDFHNLGGSRLGSWIPSFRYGASDLEETRWMEIDYVSFHGMPDQAALSSGEGFIPDPNLESVVAETLEISTGLAREDMLGLTSLSARSRGITNLGGLEYASNLEELALPNNTITDISPLSGLTRLRSLRLDGNSMDDVSPLAELENLEVLFIDTDSVADLSPISSLTKLEELTIGWKGGSDLSLLSGLTSLRMLKLSHDDVIDISPLSSLVNLQEIWLISNQIVDLSTLIQLNKLEEVVLGEDYRTLLDGSPALGHINTLIGRGIDVRYVGCE